MKSSSSSASRSRFLLVKIPPAIESAWKDLNDETDMGTLEFGTDDKGKEVGGMYLNSVASAKESGICVSDFNILPLRDSRGSNMLCISRSETGISTVGRVQQSFVLHPINTKSYDALTLKRALAKETVLSESKAESISGKPVILSAKDGMSDISQNTEIHFEKLQNDDDDDDDDMQASRAKKRPRRMDEDELRSCLFSLFQDQKTDCLSSTTVVEKLGISKGSARNGLTAIGDYVSKGSDKGKYRLKEEYRVNTNK